MRKPPKRIKFNTSLNQVIIGPNGEHEIYRRKRVNMMFDHQEQEWWSLEQIRDMHKETKGVAEWELSSIAEIMNEHYAEGWNPCTAHKLRNTLKDERWRWVLVWTLEDITSRVTYDPRYYPPQTKPNAE